MRSVLADVRTSLTALGSSFRSPDIAKALAAYLAFTITEWAAFIALIVYAYQDGGSVMVGLVSLLQLIPAAILAPIGSVLGDRHRRERVLFFAYASLATMTALAALALLTEAPAPLVYVAGTSAGWMITLVRPTHASLLPRLARTPEELSSAYAASGVLESFSILLGPLLAGGLMGLAPGSLSGPGVVDAALAVMLLLGTVSVASIRVRTEPAHDGGTSGVRVVAAEAVDGVRAVARDRRSLLLVATMGLAMVQLGFVDVLIVILAFDIVGTGDAGVGYLTASIGVGAVIGAAFAIGLAARWRSSRSFRWGVTWSGLSVAGIAAQPSLAGVFLAIERSGRRARRRQRAHDAAAPDPGQAALEGVRRPGIAVHGRRRHRVLPRVAPRGGARASVDPGDRRRALAARQPCWVAVPSSRSTWGSGSPRRRWRSCARHDSSRRCRRRCSSVSRGTSSRCGCPKERS